MNKSCKQSRMIVIVSRKREGKRMKRISAGSGDVNDYIGALSRKRFCERSIPLYAAARCIFLHPSLNFSSLCLVFSPRIFSPLFFSFFPPSSKAISSASGCNGGFVTSNKYLSFARGYYRQIFGRIYGANSDK